MNKIASKKCLSEILNGNLFNSEEEKKTSCLVTIYQILVKYLLFLINQTLLTCTCDHLLKINNKLRDSCITFLRLDSCLNHPLINRKTFINAIIVINLTLK